MPTSHTSGKFVTAALGLALGAGGCATGQTTARVHSTDLRGSARVSTPAPVVIVMGPVRLLHVNIDKKAGAHFIRVPHRAGDAAMPDCGAGAPLVWDGESDLDVGSGESVCVAVNHDTRISWHARQLPAPVGFQQAAR